MSSTVNMGERSTALTPDPSMLFANLVERCVCVGLDVALAMFLAGVPSGLVSRAAGSGFRTIVIVALLLLYFAAFWTSRLRATPVQFLFGLRVVDEKGERMGLARATLRGLLIVGLICASLTVLAAPSKPYLGLVALVAYGLLLLGALTSKRQAAHDLLVRSLVVRAKALRRPEYRAYLAELAADTTRAFGRELKPSFMSLIEAVIVLGLPAYAQSIPIEV